MTAMYHSIDDYTEYKVTNITLWNGKGPNLTIEQTESASFYRIDIRFLDGINNLTLWRCTKTVFDERPVVSPSSTYNSVRAVDIIRSTIDLIDTWVHVPLDGHITLLNFLELSLGTTSNDDVFHE